ncbi:MAG: hypothetical protein OXQ30_12965, partial [Boseongicola sp.]|nr:hypothetical protein [Boseongicola sp.]
LNQAKDVIKKAIHEVLTEIAETNVEITPHVDRNDSSEGNGDGSAGSDSTTAGSDRKPVGGS